MSHFLQIHALHSFAASLLNRDDMGMAKRLPFGGATRTRVSSQCLKRHWRTFEGEYSLGSLGPLTVRSRRTFDRYVYEPLVKEHHIQESLAREVVEALVTKVLGESPKKKAEKAGKAEKTAKVEKAAEPIETNQVVVLGRPEVEHLAKIAREICLSVQADSSRVVGKLVEERFKADKDNFESLRLASGLDAALFGRMVTSDILSRGDAAIHVAHAFTVHAEASETDYFAAIDDIIQEEGELGSGHINTTELTTGLFYTYVAVDVPLLISNLEGCKRSEWQKADRTLAANVLHHLVHLIAKVSPGAKLGSTAPYAYAHMLLAETGKSQPRTLANAFLKPVSTRGNLLENTYAAMTAHLHDLESMYGAQPVARVAAMGPKEELAKQTNAEALSLPALAAWVAQTLREA